MLHGYKIICYFVLSKQMNITMKVKKHQRGNKVTFFALDEGVTVKGYFVAEDGLNSEFLQTGERLSAIFLRDEVKDADRSESEFFKTLIDQSIHYQEYSKGKK